MSNLKEQNEHTPNMKMITDIEDVSFYKKLLDFIPTGIGIYRIIDQTAYLVYLNDGYYSLLGTTRKERERFGGGMFFDAIHPSDIADVKKMILTIIEQKMDHTSATFRILNGTGEYVWLQLNVRVVSRKVNEITIYCAYTDIHSEMLGQEQYKQANALLNAAMHGLKSVTWIFDCTNRTIFQTEDAVNQFGFPEVIRNVPESFFEDGNVHPDSQEDFRFLYEEAIRGSGTVQVDAQVKNKERTGYIWLRIILSPVESKGEKPTRYIGVSVDVTDQKIREIQYEAQFEMMEHADTNNLLGKGKWNLTRDVRELYSGENDAALSLPKDAKLDDLLEKMKMLFTNEEDYERMRANFSCEKLIQNFYRGKTNYTFEFRHRTNDQSIQWVRFQCYVREIPNKNELVCFALDYDVTEEYMRKHLLNKVLESEFDMLCILAVESRKLVMRSVRNTILNVEDPDQFVFKKEDYEKSCESAIYHAVAKEDRARMQELLKIENLVQHLRWNKQYSFTFQAYDTIGNLHDKRLNYTYLDETRCTILIVQSDITDVVKERNEQIQKTEVARAAAEKANQEKTEFLARMSHDMRTPMNGIIGLTKLTKRLENLPEEAVNNLSAIEESGAFLLSLINEVLDMNKIESRTITLNPSVVFSRTLIDNIVGAVSSLISEKELKFETSYINVISDYIRLDRLRFQQIFVNILSNAVKFTKKGGIIRFEIERLKLEDGISYDRFSIEDNGIGMSEEFLPHIFEPFSQEHGELTTGMVGTGLGMPIVKELVDLMGGSIKVESKRGIGTKVTVYLSIEHIENYSETDEQTQEEYSEDLSGKTILLVEDHPINAMITKKLLELKGIKIRHAVNGKEAVDMFHASEKGEYMAILMDIRMPVMDGLEATRIIRKQEREDAKTVPIIAMTANAFEEDVRNGLDAGMNEYLSKPVDSNVLLSTLSKYV